jgi:solute carrier family 25 S-adenosylmethionine transporter 26
MSELKSSFSTALVAGAVAGIAVDISLYPLDTLKTRMQSSVGFRTAGGFKGLYKGVPAAALGSGPSSALFFYSYESMKGFLENSSLSASSRHVVAAATAEVAACLIRVPTDNVKQKVQAGAYETVGKAFSHLLVNSKGMSKFFVGFSATCLRDVPFACIQFPIYEFLKLHILKEFRSHDSLLPVYLAGCGSCAGAISAAITTPLDVVKTRLMLGKDKSGIDYTDNLSTIRRMWSHEGWRVFFSGISPRVFWISLGGFVFFGAYESTKRLLI